MPLINKFHTAATALKTRGVSEVLRLLFKNIRLYVSRLWRRPASLLWGVSLKFSGKPGNRHRKLHILYITDRGETEVGLTIHYRIHNLREALRGRAYTRFEMLENGVYQDSRKIAWADLVVLMRLEWSPEVETIVAQAKSFKIPVVYDIDDILFLPEYSERFCAILTDGTQHKSEKYKNIFVRQSQTFIAADFATASTPYIADLMAANNKKAFVIHNGLSQGQLHLAAGLKQPRREKQGLRMIGYLSGSPTHNTDFKQAYPAVLRIFEEYQDVGLNIVGYLDLDSLPEELKPRVKTTGFMSRKKLLRTSAQNTINIAPLDESNPFCHAKSELKYFEAAVVGVPTVASGTDTFRRCIRSGENGFVASDEDEWYDALKALLDDRQLYQKVSRNAYEHSVGHYSPKAIGDEAMKAYLDILEEYGKQNHNKK